MSPSAFKEFPAVQRMIPLRLLLESRIRQPRRLNPGMSCRTSAADHDVQEPVIIRFKQFDGVRGELLDVEELEGVASVTCVSPLSASEVTRKFSSTTSSEDEATCSSTTPSMARSIIRRPSSPKMFSTTSL